MWRVRARIGWAVQCRCAATVWYCAQAAVFVLATVVGGVSFGAAWPLLVILVSELFGSAHLATNYTFYDGICGCVGSIAFGNYLPSVFYDRAASGGTCTGAACFGPTHLIISMYCLSSAAASLVLAWRSAGLYRRLAGMHARREPA